MGKLLDIINCNITYIVQYIPYQYILVVLVLLVEEETILQGLFLVTTHLYG